MLSKPFFLLNNSFPALVRLFGPIPFTVDNDGGKISLPRMVALPRASELRKRPWWVGTGIQPRKWAELAPPDLAEAFAYTILAADKQTPHTPEKALLAVHLPAIQWSQGNRVQAAALLMRRADVQAIIIAERDEAAKAGLLTRHERRRIVDGIARTSLVDVVTPDGELRQDLTEDQRRAVKRHKTTCGKDGVTTEVETYDPIAAARLGAELAGEITRGAVAVQVNVGDQRQDRPAKDLLADLRAKGVDVKAVVDAYLGSIEGAGKTEG